MNYLKLSLKIIGGFSGFILLLIIAGGVFIMIYVDKPLVEEQMRKALNRHVTIESINVSIFSVLSGIEVNDVRISNFKTGPQLEALREKPVPENDLFAGLKSFKFNVELRPLLDRRFVLTELMLYEPKINIIKEKAGYFNFSDLIVPSDDELEDPPPPSEPPAEPVSVDSIPVAISIGSIGMQDGTITMIDRQLNQTVQLYGITAKVYNIEIDPEKLESKNNINIKFSLGAKNIGEVKTGTVNSFDIMLSAEGRVIPFDLKSRELDPEITLELGSPGVSVTGLEIFEALNSVDKISEYSGKFKFLEDTVKWEDAHTSIWYKSDLVKFEGARMKTSDFNLAFEGSHNIATKALDINLEMTVEDKHKKSLESGIENNVVRVIPRDALNVVSAEKIAAEAMKPLLNDKEQVFLVYKVTGTTSRPSVRLIRPELPSLQEIARRAGADLTDIARKRAAEAVESKKKEAEDTAKEKAKEEAGDIRDKAGDRARKLF